MLIFLFVRVEMFLQSIAIKFFINFFRSIEFNKTNVLSLLKLENVRESVQSTLSTRFFSKIRTNHEFRVAISQTRDSTKKITCVKTVSS